MLSIYRELINYLAAHVSPEDILAYRVSAGEQERADELTEHNKEGRLSADEARELAELIEFDELLSHLKVQALVHQRQPQQS
jgi:hypothetical protein